VTELDLVVSTVCSLAEDYRTFGDRNAVDLVRRSGYLDHRARITVDRLAECLAVRPDWVSSWFAWSDDSRGSSKWYILECGPAHFEVGYFDGERHPLDSIADRVRACAEYVQREVASIADLA
jgi:hypothetical protein